MADFFADPQVLRFLQEAPFAIWETVYATLIATALSYVIGLPLGVVLVAGENGRILKVPGPLMTALNVAVNLLRSVPFLILMVIVIPLSRLLLGTSVGTPASIVPLVAAAAPFVARIVESSLRELDAGVVEAAQAGCCWAPAWAPRPASSPWWRRPRPLWPGSWRAPCGSWTPGWWRRPRPWAAPPGRSSPR